ncbi:MAG: acetyl-CoA carboxylase biotin carboxyl carrier protein subunit, partial [Acidimicrobiales bacterium]
GSPLSAPVAPSTAPEEPVPRVEREVEVEVDGRRYQVRLWVPETGSAGVGARRRPLGSAAGGPAAGPGAVVAPMQGTVASVLVAVGAEVETGQALLVLEAMKMENQIRAERGGRVAELRVEVGATVGVGDILVLIE